MQHTAVLVDLFTNHPDRQISRRDLPLSNKVHQNRLCLFTIYVTLDKLLQLFNKRAIKSSFLIGWHEDYIEQCLT